MLGALVNLMRAERGVGGEQEMPFAGDGMEMQRTSRLDRLRPQMRSRHGVCSSRFAACLGLQGSSKRRAALRGFSREVLDGGPQRDARLHVLYDGVDLPLM